MAKRGQSPLYGIFCKLQKEIKAKNHHNYY